MMSSRRIRCGYLYVKLLSVAAVAVSLCGFFFFCIFHANIRTCKPPASGLPQLPNFPITRGRSQTRRPHSCASSVRHLRKSSLRASGLIWFRMPPSRLEVASEATIKGRTTVGGIWRRTPPTAPGRPFCS